MDYSPGSIDMSSSSLYPRALVQLSNHQTHVIEPFAHETTVAHASILWPTVPPLLYMPTGQMVITQPDSSARGKEVVDRAVFLPYSWFGCISDMTITFEFFNSTRPGAPWPYAL